MTTGRTVEISIPVIRTVGRPASAQRTKGLKPEGVSVLSHCALLLVGADVRRTAMRCFVSLSDSSRRLVLSWEFSLGVRLLSLDLPGMFEFGLVPLGVLL